MRIWIHLHGAQQGPYSLEQLRSLPVTPSTPVWYDGLEDWSTAGEAPETAVLFVSAAAPPPPPVLSPIQPMGQMSAPPEPPVVCMVAAEMQPRQEPEPVKPPTYVVWSVVLMLICCSPVALLALIAGIVSGSRWKAGDVAGARRMSSVAEWLIIFTIVLGFMTLPLGLIFIV